MFDRLIKPVKSYSCFLFGPRGTGKTTFLNGFLKDKKVLWIDLLDPSVEDRYAQDLGLLTSQIEEMQSSLDWVVVDEVQKLPRLLDIAHQQIEKNKLKFALTGSSARKLKRGQANLLAGRAFVYHFHPLTHLEMGSAFCLNEALHWGTLPKITQFETDEEKRLFLQSYALTYLKEEVWAEHIVKNLDPFRKFLGIAAQTNGEIVNYSNIARDVGVDTKTVISYFEILEDTLVGFSLPAFGRSLRKQQIKSPKFYLFDTGVKRAMEKSLSQILLPQTYGYGNAFEHFIIAELHRLNDYFQKDFSFSYLTTKDGAEIDLIVERPGMPEALLEIKSSEHVDERDTKAVEHFLKDFKKAEGFCLSRDLYAKKIGSVTCLPWPEGFKELGLAKR